MLENNSLPPHYEHVRLTSSTHAAVQHVLSLLTKERIKAGVQTLNNQMFWVQHTWTSGLLNASRSPDQVKG